MHDPMYMIVNLAIGGMAGTPSDGLPDGSEMNIDYIRAYSLDDLEATNAASTAQTSEWLL
jgi:beta-glucanase (GH16 family)